jgi:hypothetical protein
LIVISTGEDAHATAGEDAGGTGKMRYRNNALNLLRDAAEMHLHAEFGEH